MKKIIVFCIALSLQANLIFAQVITEKGVGTVELTGRTCSNGKPSNKKLHLEAIERQSFQDGINILQNLVLRKLMFMLL